MTVANSDRSPERRAKVLMLVDNLRSTGGAETFLTGLATHLPRESYDVTVCATRDLGGALVEPLSAAGVPRFSLARKRTTDLLAFRRLFAFLRAESVDVLHAHKFGSNVWGALFGAICRVPVVVAHEHGSSWHSSTRRLLDHHLVGRLATAVVTTSTADRDSLRDTVRVPERKLFVIPAAYVRRSVRGRGDLRAEIGIPPDAPVIGTIAVLREEKRLAALIEAFALVLKSLPNARLVIAGAGPCRGMLERDVLDRGIARNVHFLGFRNDIDVVLQGIDVGAMSSEREGTPVFGFECMAYGKPLVATDVGGLSDVFRDGTEACLVPPGDPRALATALESLLRDPNRREALGRAAHGRLPQFTIERIAAEFDRLYRRLLREKGVPL